MLWRREGMACNIKQDFNTLQEIMKQNKIQF